MKTAVDKIRNAIYDWYGQQFAHTGGFDEKIEITDSNDHFTGSYGYEHPYKTDMTGIATDTTYTITDNLTHEYITFGLNDIESYLCNLNKPDCAGFESEMLSDLYLEFVEIIDEPDYDIYHKTFK